MYYIFILFFYLSFIWISRWHNSTAPMRTRPAGLTANRFHNRVWASVGYTNTLKHKLEEITHMPIKSYSKYFLLYETGKYIDNFKIDFHVLDKILQLPDETECNSRQLDLRWAMIPVAENNQPNYSFGHIRPYHHFILILCWTPKKWIETPTPLSL